MSAKLYFFLFVGSLFVKLTLLVWVSFYGHDFFGGGNDSDYYHAYALGLENTVTSIWPVILRMLNNAGMYSRSGVSGCLVFLGVVLIPYMVASLSVTKNSPVRNKAFWGMMLLVSTYPTLFYYTFDIYRDVFMVFVFLLGLFLLRIISSSRLSFYTSFIYLLAIAIAYLLFLLRSYLGFAFGFSLVFSGLYSFKRYPVFLSFIALLVGLNTLYFLGLLDPILRYRSIFSEHMVGGANLGILFSSTDTFFLDLFKSTSYQLFGFFFFNLPSIVVFVLESVPFLCALIYLFINKKYSNAFVDYIIVFFVAYSAVWLLGNDNLGTAVRLRIFNYLAVYIACMIVYQNKITSSIDRSMA